MKTYKKTEKNACGNLSTPPQKKIVCPESGGHCPGSHKILATGLAARTLIKFQLYDINLLCVDNAQSSEHFKSSAYDCLFCANGDQSS